jgi:hypothetical protein
MVRAANAGKSMQSWESPECGPCYYSTHYYAGEGNGVRERGKRLGYRDKGIRG